jgi:predicted CXXCH cytochrome family protein
VLLEWLLTAVAAALTVRVLGLRERYAAALLLVMLVFGAAVALATSSARSPPRSSPIATRGEGFATSKACLSCHPSEYSSWHASYHRRMTQPADAQAVASPLLRQGGRLRAETAGRSVELFTDREQLWARVPDPQVSAAVAAEGYEAAFRAAPARDVPVRLLTGSHHHQAFWVAGARQGELRALPVVYLIDEQQLIPRRDAFLNPPDAPEQAVRWNSNCVQCHTVAGAPAHDEQTDAFRSSAAELGVACEACHGAADEHVRNMQNPLRRYRARAGEREVLGIVDPAQLSAERASQVCGRCHSYFYPKDEATWWQSGFTTSYRPGDDLSRAQLLLSPEVLKSDGAPSLTASADSLFYDDGTIRVGGREYNGLVKSPCFERGRGERQLSCLSCHSLHRSKPDDQLGEGKEGNDACLTCHQEKRDVAAHTRHAPASAGSLCYNCHMPHTTYALLGAIRSHRVDSPSFDERTLDRPNACSLCHVEQSEAWAARHAAGWFGEKPSLTLARGGAPADAHLPAGALFALRGDAAVRAITAAALGRSESSAAAVGLRRQLLGILAQDDYAAVRTIAARSLDSLPPASDTPLDSSLVERLLGERDLSPVTIAE